MADNYEVGYKKPPKNKQYKKGQSGNPAGRKKGSLGLRTIMKEVFYQSVVVKQNGTTKKIPMIGAVLTTLVTKSVQGDLKAISLTLKHASETLPLEDEPDEVLPVTPPEAQAKSREFFRNLRKRLESGEKILACIDGKEVLVD